MDARRSAGFLLFRSGVSSPWLKSRGRCLRFRAGLFVLETCPYLAAILLRLDASIPARLPGASPRGILTTGCHSFTAGFAAIILRSIRLRRPSTLTPIATCGIRTRRPLAARIQAPPQRHCKRRLHTDDAERMQIYPQHARSKTGLSRVRLRCVAVVAPDEFGLIRVGESGFNSEKDTGWKPVARGHAADLAPLSRVGLIRGD